ncbi:Alpha/Beta hydrolase protein [Crucibulum laeve]|uniref:GPI inositol-deacylase n=1 Tax=Crucibulum laeve TaxID=68775 RepID=A0A5C3LXN6_9AGAR|nr:Alpha/Beta hydrolase protein [Crucibulum laeve]
MRVPRPLPSPRSPTPVLRWLSNLTSQLNTQPLTSQGPRSRPHSPHHRTYSLPPSPSASTSTGPNLDLLNEALTEPLQLTRPPPARLPPSFSTSHNLSRPPPFLDNLTRSTLPTSSLSPPHYASVYSEDSSFPHSAASHSANVIQPPPIVLTHSPPTRSSLDSLRSLSARSHTRTISTLTANSPDDTQTSTATSAFSRWFQSESKDALLTEDDRATSSAEIKKKYKSPKNPVVFCHGLLGFDSVSIGPSIAPLEVTHWRGIKEVLEQNGTEVLITRVPATSSPVDRAKVLEQKVSEVYPGRSVHLIGHSMGGLDCRYLTTHLTQRKFKVLSITTIATPHRGSSFADHFLSTVGPSRMPSVLSLLDLLPNGGGDGKAFECLTVESMRKFNEETPDVEGVRYFSWGATYEPGLIDTWKWPHSVILEKEGPNDGLVSVQSAKWGTYLGTLSHVNHLDLVGWINTARYKWAEMMGKEIKFRPATFYMGIADMLAKEVEGQKEDEQPVLHDSPKVGRGVELTEEGAEHGLASVEEASAKQKPTAEEGGEDKERAQMVDSLDTAGAHVGGKDSPSPSAPRTRTNSSTTQKLRSQA